MGLSEWICYKKESPNCNDRTEKISKITIHHMAGNLSVEACCNLLSNPARQASANYCIGSDGRIAGMVDENKRSWASSSPWNDQRAITIEVANDELGGNWHVSDKAYESLIKQCAQTSARFNTACIFSAAAGCRLCPAATSTIWYMATPETTR